MNDQRNKRSPVTRRSTHKKKPPEERIQRGGVDRTAMFPVAIPRSAMPADYAFWLAELKQRIRQERLRVVLASNAAMVLLYWDIGGRILQKQSDQGWGSRVIDRLAADLQDAFPEMKGFSPRNLKYMRAFAAAWPERSIVQQVVAQLTWGHNIVLLERVRSTSDRLWYAAKTQREGWSRRVLAVQIETGAHRREGRAQSNFPVTLPSSDSDLAVQVFKDPYLFDFLGTDAPRREAELERGLVDHIQKFLLDWVRVSLLSGDKCIWKSATRISTWTCSFIISSCVATL